MSKSSPVTQLFLDQSELETLISALSSHHKTVFKENQTMPESVQNLIYPHLARMEKLIGYFENKAKELEENTKKSGNR